MKTGVTFINCQLNLLYSGCLFCKRWLSFYLLIDWWKFKWHSPFCLSQLVLLSGLTSLCSVETLNWSVKRKQPAGSTLPCDWPRREPHYVTSSRKCRRVFPCNENHCCITALSLWRHMGATQHLSVLERSITCWTHRVIITEAKEVSLVDFLSRQLTMTCFVTFIQNCVGKI